MKKKNSTIKHLRKLTLSRMAKKTGTTKVANVRFWLFAIPFRIGCIVLLATLISPIEPCMFEYYWWLFGTTGILLLLSIGFLACASKKGHADWWYLKTKEGKILDLDEYKQKAIKTYFIKKKYITEGKSNKDFYLALKDSIKDNIKPARKINASLQLAIIAIILSIITPLINAASNWEDKIYIAYMVSLAYFILVVLYQFLINNPKNKTERYYKELDSILDELLMQDAIDCALTVQQTQSND